MDKPAPPKRDLQLIADAKKLGIENPEQFGPAELRALINALAPADDVGVSLAPSSTSTVIAPSEPEPEPEPETHVENAFFKEPPPAIPHSLNQDRIWLTGVDPETLFATWDSSEPTRERARSGEGPITLRIQSPDVPGHLDVQVDLRAPSWYVRAPANRVRVVALLGFGSGHQFRPVAQSPVVSVPPAIAAPIRETFRVTIPYDLDRRELARQSVEAWARGQSAPAHPELTVSPGPTPLAVVERVRQAPPEELRALIDPPLPHEEEGEGEWEETWETSWEVGNLPSSASSGASARGFQAGKRRRQRKKGRHVEGLYQPPTAPGAPSSGAPSSASMPSSSSSITSRGRP